MRLLRRGVLGLLSVLWVALAWGIPMQIETNGLQVRIQAEVISHLVSQVRTTEKGVFVELQLDGAGVTSEVGKPKLPVIREFLEVPDGAVVRAEYRVLRTESRNSAAEGLRVLPVQPPIPKVPNPRVPFAYDVSAYQKPGPYPGLRVRTQEAGILRGHRLVLVEIYPVQYDPVQGTLWMDDFEVTLTIEGGNLPAYLQRIQRWTDYYSKKVVEKLTLNSKALLASIPAQEVGYLIIVPDAYADAIQPLADWRRDMGFYTWVVPKSQAGNSAPQIQAFIQNAYNTWPVPPTFVVLVGDVDQMPYFTGQGTGSPPTDLNYGLVDGTDYFPDLFVSRLSVASSTQLSQVVDKILTYETTAWSQGTEWAQKAYFMASDDPSYHQVAEGTHLYCMAIVRNYGMIADSLFEYYGTGTPVSVALNEGRSLAIYSGHGYEGGWAGPSFDQGDINALTNLDRYPMVQSYACLTGDFTYPECFMETWLRAPNKGAAAALGSSVTSYWDEDDILQRRMFDAQFDSTLYWTMGFINMAKYLLYLHYGNTGTVRRYFEMYNLQGDPAMDVFTAVPETLFVSHPSAIPIGPANVTVTVSDPSGPVAEALVAIRNTDSLLATGWTDASGSVTLTVTTTQVEPLTVTVTAHNHKPSQTQIMTVSDLPYVSLVGYFLNDDNGDGYMSPNESAMLDVAVKNWGNQTANNVTGVLRYVGTGVQENTVTIIDSTEDFGSLGPGDSLFVSSAFAFSVGTVVNGQSLPFELWFFSSDGDTWTSPLTVTAGTPVLVLEEITVQDPSGNGVVDPGETADLIATLGNVGLCASEAAQAVLRTSDPYITLVDSEATFPPILPDSTAAGDAFTIEADLNTPLHHSVHFVLQITSGSYTFTDSFDLMIGVGGHYLVWDPDPNHSSGPVIASLLDSLGLTGDYTTDLTPYLDELPYYQSVFVCVGIFSDNYTIQNGSPEAQALEAYLNEYGGRLYLEGGDVWYWDPQYSNGYDFGPLFGIQALDDGTSDLGVVVGESGTFTEGMTFYYSGENAWIDHLAPTGNAYAIFHNQSPYYICGVANVGTGNGGEYRTVGLSFEMAGLTGQTGSSLHDLVQEIAIFFGLPMDVEESPTVTGPRVVSLRGPTPNPFRTQTSIQFGLPTRQRVQLQVYDITGRQITTLVNGILPAGYHTVSWAGTDRQGRPIAQGLYFIRLKTDEKTLTRKVLKLQ